MSVIWQPVAYVLAALALALGLLAGWQHVRWTSHAAADASAEARAERQAKAREDSWRQSVTNERRAAVALQEKYDADTSRLLAGIDTGAVRVRDRFKCPVPGPARPGPVVDGGPARPEQPTGLQESDVKFLVGIGVDADTVSMRLLQCQAYVRTVTGAR